jgi:hypothetical protein
MRYLALPLVLALTGAAVAGTIYLDPKAPGGSVGGNDMVNFIAANHFVLGENGTAEGAGFWTAEPFADPATGESLLPWDRWSGAIEWAFFEHVPGVWADPRLAPNGSTNFGVPAATAFASGVATVTGGAVTKVPNGTTNVHFGPEFYYTVDFGGPVSLLGSTPTWFGLRAPTTGGQPALVLNETVGPPYEIHLVEADAPWEWPCRLGEGGEPWHWLNGANDSAFQLFGESSEIPEPGTLLLLGGGLIGLAVVARRRPRRRISA